VVWTGFQFPSFPLHPLNLFPLFILCFLISSFSLFFPPFFHHCFRLPLVLLAICFLFPSTLPLLIRFVLFSSLHSSAINSIITLFQENWRSCLPHALRSANLELFRFNICYPVLALSGNALKIHGIPCLAVRVRVLPFVSEVIKCHSVNSRCH
jgi:hypothetical protein